jgi:hypothetical protein
VKPVPLLSKRNLKRAVTDYAPSLLGVPIPGFIRIHLRYILSNPFVWGVLFVAPFVIGLLTLSQFCRVVLKIQPSGWQLFLTILFLIALAFYFAERNRTFRSLYVRAIPAIVILNGLFRLFQDLTPLFGKIIVFLTLSVFPAWILGRLSMGMGYRMLSNGADRKYRPGRDHFMAGDYERAFSYLEPSAKRGHMKSLFLMGRAYEQGLGCQQDRIKAARFYDKSAKKGYTKAQSAYEALVLSFSAEEKASFDQDMMMSSDLF